MSNKSAKKEKNTTKKKSTETVVSQSHYIFNDERKNEAPIWQIRIYTAIIFFSLPLLLTLSYFAGINADEGFQIAYSEKLVNYFFTFGKDSSALNVPEGNMHIYGGTFEFLTGLINKLLGFKPGESAYHAVRNMAVAMLGWAAIFSAAQFARHCAGLTAGIITFLLLLFSPRFFGDSLMNPKDIPFAAGYIIALFHLALVLDKLPRPPRKHVIGLILGLGLALGVRAGGLLVFCWVAFFALIHFYIKQKNASEEHKSKLLKAYAIYISGILIAGYIIGLLFWPFGLQNPISNPLYALNQFSSFKLKILTLFEGQNVMSDVLPWFYPIKWISMSIPLSALLGIVGSIVSIPWLLRSYRPLWLVMALTTGFFPVFYVIYKNANIYDGWRHLIFIYPPLMVAAGIFWSFLIKKISNRKQWHYAIYSLFFLLTLDALIFIVKNPLLAYVYFNPTVGGLQGAYGKYETDYWALSMRQAIEWLEKEGKLNKNLEKPLVLATNLPFPLEKYTSKYGNQVLIKQLPWEKRCDENWDYAIYITRFIDGAQLNKGFWPPDNAVYVVKANHVPLAAIFENSQNCVLGIAANKAGNWTQAIQYLEKEIQSVPDNELAWSHLAEAYLYVDSLNKAKTAIEKTLAINPSDGKANSLLGVYWISKKNFDQAKIQFEYALKKNPNNAGACYYLAVIAHQQGNPQGSAQYLEKAIKLSPDFKPAYELLAQIQEENGRPDLAKRVREIMNRNKNN